MFIFKSIQYQLKGATLTEVDARISAIEHARKDNPGWEVVGLTIVRIDPMSMHWCWDVSMKMQRSI